MLDFESLDERHTDRRRSSWYTIFAVNEVASVDRLPISLSWEGDTLEEENAARRGGYPHGDAFRRQ